MGTLQWVGRFGILDTPAGMYDVAIFVDRVTVSRGETTRSFAVPNYGTAIHELSERPGFRIGWGRYPDDAEVIYLYDRDDDNFGYAINLTAPDCSEWGYAPF